MAANLVPVTPGTVTRTLPPPVSATTRVTVTGIPVTVLTTTALPATTTLTATTVPVTVLRTTTQATKQPGTCERHYFGTGTMVTAVDGRLNCTTFISTDDQAATLTLPEGTVATDAAKKPVPEIRITPVNPSEIPPGPDRMANGGPGVPTISCRTMQFLIPRSWSRSRSARVNGTARTRPT